MNLGVHIRKELNSLSPGGAIREVYHQLNVTADSTRISTEEATETYTTLI